MQKLTTLQHNLLMTVNELQSDLPIMLMKTETRAGKIY